MEKGSLSVQTENIFPVIKRWLYSDKDIFIREAVSNAADAITKLRRLVSLAQTEVGDDNFRIDVTLNRDAKTITIADNGIGMTREEVERYINQIALSGALDFISKYEGEGDASKEGIIGHFGLGFYSVFMVSDRVEMKTRSYTGAPAVYWVCDENGRYEMAEGDKASRGTEIILHVTEDELGYLDTGRFRGILAKYCGFMPYPIYLSDGGEAEQVNDTEPLWQKNPSELTDDQYAAFYKKVFADYADPLFYVHINADYPLNFKGILYFPKPKGVYEPVEPVVKLFYNSVFVADNIKEVVPDFIPCLRGVLDCPELPLNVSRSYLQSDAYVRKVAAHIVKKVADKLCALYNKDRAGFERIWGDIRPYIEYGCMRDEKFYERVKDVMLFKDTDGSFVTVSEYLDGATEGTVYYASEGEKQGYYISLYKENGRRVLLLDKLMDAQFIQFIESKNNKLKFARVDADVDALGEKAEDNADLTALFRKVSGRENLTVHYASVEGGAPAFIRVSEESRRMADMLRMYARGEGPEVPVGEELVVNSKNVRVAALSAALSDESREGVCELAAKQIYLSALLLSRGLTEQEQTAFAELSDRLLGQLIP